MKQLHPDDQTFDDQTLCLGSRLGCCPARSFSFGGGLFLLPGTLPHEDDLSRFDLGVGTTGFTAERFCTFALGNGLRIFFAGGILAGAAIRTRHRLFENISKFGHINALGADGELLGWLNEGIGWSRNLLLGGTGNRWKVDGP